MFALDENVREKMKGLPLKKLHGYIDEDGYSVYGDEEDDQDDWTLKKY